MGRSRVPTVATASGFDPTPKPTKLLNAGRQLSVGSDRLSVATLGESQYFFDDDVTDLLFAYPL